MAQQNVDLSILANAIIVALNQIATNPGAAMITGTDPKSGQVKVKTVKEGGKDRTVPASKFAGLQVRVDMGGGPTKLDVSIPGVGRLSGNVNLWLKPEPGSVWHDVFTEKRAAAIATSVKAGIMSEAEATKLLGPVPDGTTGDDGEDTSGGPLSLAK